MTLGEDRHQKTLQSSEQLLKIMHLNTRSMVSTFDSLRLTVDRYSFDIITMSETWLKNNRALLCQIPMPSTTETKGEGEVWAPILKTIVHKRRTDIEKFYPAMENQWA